VDLTASYDLAFPVEARSRYEFLEVRNAAAVIGATDGQSLQEIIGVLVQFELLRSDLVAAGGNESKLANRLNHAFRDLGWREARVDTRVTLELRKMPYAPAGETSATVVPTEVLNHGYKVDNVIRRVALDVEWNAKDGNLDRDIGAYRALYDAGLIDAAVMVTRTTKDLQRLGFHWRTDAGRKDTKALGTATTTNFSKLQPRMTRGDSGGCPLLAVGICVRTWAGD